MYDPNTPAIAFCGHELVAAAKLTEVARSVKLFVDARPDAAVLTFDATTSRPIELDLRGTADQVVARIEAGVSAGTEPGASVGAGAYRDGSAPSRDLSAATARAAEKRGPGRPKLGVVAREVTLLPRHWEWLAAQPGGASVTLRKLVEQARKQTVDESSVREARDAAYRFMYAVGGDLPDFEEVSRALYAGDRSRFDKLTEQWPSAVRDHVRALAKPGLGAEN